MATEARYVVYTTRVLKVHVDQLGVVRKPSLFLPATNLDRGQKPEHQSSWTDRPQSIFTKTCNSQSEKCCRVTNEIVYHNTFDLPHSTSH